MKKDYSCFISAIVEQVISDIVKEKGVLDEELLELILTEYSNSIKQNYPNEDSEKRREANSKWRLKQQKRCSEYLEKSGVKDKKMEYLKYKDLENKNPKAIEEKQKIKNVIIGNTRYSEKLQKMIDNKVIDKSCLDLTAVTNIIQSKKSKKEQDKLLEIYIPELKGLEDDIRHQALLAWTQKQTKNCDKFFKKHGIIDRKDYYKKATGLEATISKVVFNGGKLVEKQNRNSIYETQSIIDSKRMSYRKSTIKK